mmetsp:Transcript_20806/g.35472  ORF Transcript_20806/g.35472 Transcript_20806/m.35472 type:complete len:85 (-) Transcript_20806:290-544(-)
MCGFRSWREADEYLHRWGEAKREQIERWNTIELSPKDHPEMMETKDMTAEELQDYLKKKYFPPEEALDDINNNNNNNDGASTSR